MIKDNIDTDPDMQNLRYRAKRGQTTLNIEIGIAGRKAVSSNNASAGSSPFTSTTVAGLTGGTSGGGVACFIGDTLISLTENKKPIVEIVTAQDEVLAFDAYSGQREPKLVIGKFEHWVNEFLMVEFDDGATGVTKEHPYWTQNGLYVPIIELDSVWHWDDGWKSRKIREKRVIEEPTLVYNLSVKDLHNYCANDDAVSNRKPDDF